MTQKKKTPDIRFAGFKGDWEENALGEVCTVSSGIMGDSLLTEGKYRLTRIETIAEGFVDESRIGYTNDKPDKAFRLNPGDILYSNINSILHMGKVAKYQGKTTLYHGINLLRLAPKTSIDSDFLLYLLNTETRRNWARTHANQAVSQASINQSLLESQKLLICSVTEQIKIGNLLSRLDSLITLQQRKVEKLQNVKKSMLEKMFPKAGSRVPELRFEGFKEPWEIKMLSEIVVRANSFSSDSQLPRVEYEDIISGTGCLNKDVYTKDNYKTGIAFQSGDVLYGKLRPYLHNWLLPTFSGIAVGDFWVLQPLEIDSGFLYRLVQSQQFDEVANQSTGTKMPRADWKLVSKTEFAIPVSIKEQKLIGDYLQSLDSLITLQQRKLEKLQNVKKAMLEKMFV